MRRRGRRHGPQHLPERRPDRDAPGSPQGRPRRRQPGRGATTSTAPCAVSSPGRRRCSGDERATRPIDDPGSTLDRLLSGGPRLTVGMITADLARLGAEMAVLEEAGVELVHVDVMDGVFCPAVHRRPTDRRGDPEPDPQGRPPHDRRPPGEARRVRRRPAPTSSPSTSRAPPSRTGSSRSSARRATSTTRRGKSSVGSRSTRARRSAPSSRSSTSSTTSSSSAVNPGWGGQPFIACDGPPARRGPRG